MSALQQYSPGSPGYVRDYAVMLPLAETIGRSAAFAVSRQGGDHADQAFAEWLAASHLVMPDLPTVWDARLTSTVTLSATLHWSGFEPGSYYGDEIRLATRGPRYIGPGNLRRSPSFERAYSDAIRAENHLRWVGPLSGWYTEADPTHHYADAQGRFIEVVTSRFVATDSGDRIPADTRDDALATLTQPDVSAQVRVAYANREYLRDIATEWRTAGLIRRPGRVTARMTRPVVTVEHTSDAWQVARDITPARAIAHIWESEGADGVARMLSIHPAMAISTDEWLAMMRDTAIHYRWCPEHHTLITRVTHATRQPFGVMGSGGTVTVRITLPESGSTNPVTSFLNGVSASTPESVVSQLHHYVNNEHYGASVELIDGNVHSQEWRPAAHRSQEWPSDIGDASDRTVEDSEDSEDNEDQYYCSHCDEYSDWDHSQQYCEPCGMDYCEQSSHDQWYCDDCGQLICDSTGDDHETGCAECGEDYRCNDGHSCEESDDDTIPTGNPWNAS